MSKKTDWEALSAYLDGESDDPEGMARHLAQSAEAKAQLAALESLSQQVRSLPKPDVSPAFATRVIAHVAQSQRPAHGWFERHGLMLKAACVVLAVAMGVLVWPPDRLGDDVGQGGAGDDALWAALETQLAASEDSEQWVSSQLLFGDEVPDEEAGDLAVDLANSDWFEELAVYWDGEQELGDLLVGLDEYEAEAFVELLLEYGAEDARI